MATTAIDLDMLNELFDKQKSLDDIFNEDFFLEGSMLFDDQVSETSNMQESQDFLSNDDLSFNTENKFILQKSRSVIYFIVPLIMEVAVISYGIFYIGLN